MGLSFRSIDFMVFYNKAVGRYRIRVDYKRYYSF